jgi:hypothetical protein
MGLRASLGRRASRSGGGQWTAGGCGAWIGVGERTPPRRGFLVPVATRTGLRGVGERRTALALIVMAVSLALGGCGGDPAAPLATSADKARDALAFSSVQQGLVAAGLVRAESGGSYGAGADDLGQRLQERDPSLRFSTAPSSGPTQIQVLGGGSSPALLMARSSSDAYLGAWTDGTTTVYYRGDQPPQLTTEPPSGAGWSDTPPG